MPKVAEVLAQELKRAGIDTVFGLPGGENIAVVDAIQRTGIDFVLVHHEASAAYMASAMARLTGKPSACLATLGPGAANAVAGVAHAYLDRAPVLFISAQIPDKLRPLHTHQYINLQAMFEPITKGSFQLEANTARSIIEHAMALTMKGRPGPVHLQVSADMAGMEAGDEQVSFMEEMNTRLDDIDEVRHLIKNFQRPVILAGLGFDATDEHYSLAKLCEKLDAPVILTPKAKGALDARHPLYAGTIGLTQSDPVYEILDEADGILALGFDVVELVKPWQHYAPVIWIAPWENTDPQLPATAELVGEVGQILSQLDAFQTASNKNWGTECVATLHKKQSSIQLPMAKSGRLLPQDVLSAVRQTVNDDAIVTTDVGSHKILAALEWPTYTPNSYLLSNGLSCMGYGLPAAIAASRLYPERQVVCFTGDAGLLMAMGELAQLRDTKAPLVIVVFNDNALDLIRAKQLKAAINPQGTEFHGPDWGKIAGAFGLGYAQVNDEAACKLAMQGALDAAQPIIIDALIDPSSYPTSARNQL
ncbi:MAG: thiamine pyrophosphate-binding protein [Chloroflexi bacterium]|nr:MAG: thiamine pyrophosphate-binding protein [Chloroflexota bacterium]MBL1194628.1 thiamine pyrophosphate-binding protein [Chloroflexota bacterium]NOH11918.1 thiamine pyrophosphate-binding protein [Chloroflexota bacterium]